MNLHHPVKRNFHCLILAALALALPAFADEKVATTEAWPMSATSLRNPGRLLREIDFKVLLQHYEKLKTEAAETRVQLALVGAGDSNAAITGAEKALATVENDKSASKEDLEKAKRKYEDFVAREQARLKTRLSVLEELTAEVRKEAQVIAEILAKETALEAKTAIAQPQS